MKFTKKLRQEIVKDFCLRHAGVWDATAFLDEVRQKGKEHPAFGWFEWDRDKAAREYQLIQARNFANDLVIRFTIEELHPKKGIRIREAAMPMVLSPSSTWNAGGGYFISDPEDPAKMQAYCNQAAVSLRSWLNRFGAAMTYLGMDQAQIEKIAHRLETSEEAPPRMIAAE